MPESFMLDDSVPAHWRMLGILNGFWINHLKVYATNAWFAEKLRCSERTISEAVAKLEELEIAYCKRTGNSRIILPRSQLLPTPQPTSTSGSNQLLHNSDINSDSKTSSSSEDEEKSSYTPTDPYGNPVEQRRLKVSKEAKEVIALFVGWNPAAQSWSRIPAQYQAAHRLAAAHGITKIQKAIDFARDEYKLDPYCPSVSSPWELEQKWKKLQDYRDKKYG